jgi:hypothetical protein
MILDLRSVWNPVAFHVYPHDSWYHGQYEQIIYINLTRVICEIVNDGN